MRVDFYVDLWHGILQIKRLLLFRGSDCLFVLELCLSSLLDFLSALLLCSYGRSMSPTQSVKLSRLTNKHIFTLDTPFTFTLRRKSAHAGPLWTTKTKEADVSTFRTFHSSTNDRRLENFILQ